ncbi:hypothetical protein U9M48_016363 [Paspalum notatum var. saurae]|uniref:AP2/ERF domain-containing protein n=1 Tax=Paspalum notatum var. saurae TaxID=547442 RepID=A0AAQ3WMR9_PASNO
MAMDMDAADYSSACSSSSSVSPPASPTAATTHRLPPKRRAGRKKFRETRHPVFRGVRARAGGTRWVCEVREPQAQARIWLGTYPTPEMAARAHDVAAIALRGALAADHLNFPDSAHTLPRARTAAPDDIRCAAAQAAELYRRPAASTYAAGTPAPEPTAPAPPLQLSVSLPEEEETTTAAFLDEDAIFDMPGLIDDMARGMMLTPPAFGSLGRGGLDWDWATTADDDDDHSHYMDYCTLWMLD